MSDESEYAKYAKDSRIACKYGTKCYQKNPIHLKKYKHPPNKNNQQTSHVNKKMRVEKADKRTKEIVTSNDVSDSDEYNRDDDASSKKENFTSKKDENLLDSNEENGTSATKPSAVQISNNVSASEDSDDETNTSEKDIPNSNDETVTSTTKFSDVTISHDISALEDSNNKNVEKKEIDKTIEDSSKNKEKAGVIKLDYKQFINEKFLVHMPEDFYQFWKYCKKMKPNSPVDALKDIGLKLVGPFDVVAGRFDHINKSDEEYLVHWRYYRDPPEFQTVLKGDDKTGYHIGYFRDSPDELPIFLANSSAKKDGVLHQMGVNIFAAVNFYLEDLKKSGDPFKKMHIGRIQTSIKKEAETLKLDLSQKTDKFVAREKKVVARTFNKIGLIVPYNRKTQLGYRELALSNKDLHTLFTKLQNALPEQRPKYLAELQPVFTFASIATDECDFGTGIELGWNIISHGVDCLNSTALNFLTISYRLLKKEAFAKIAEAHMANRKKGCDLSIL